MVLAGPLGAGQGSSPSLPNGGFEAGLAGWAQSASNGSSPFAAVPSPGASGGSAAADLPPGVTAVLELPVPLAPGEIVESAPPPGRPGPKLEFGLWVWPAPDFSGGLWLELEAVGASGATLLAESPRVEAFELVPGRWTYLATLPTAGTDGRVQSDTTELRYRLRTEASGGLWVDGAQAGPFEYAACDVEAASFEDWQPGSGAWTASGGVTSGPTALAPHGYYGPGFAQLPAAGGAQLSQLVQLGGVPGASAPRIGPGREVEAGIWLHLPDGSGLGVEPDPQLSAELQVWARSARSGSERLVARGSWSPAVQQEGHWRFLQTSPLQTLAPGEEALRLALVNDLGTELVADFAQLGELHGIDGNPRRRVGANYVGHFRSPSFPGAWSDPSGPAERWRNWHWTVPPACDSGFSGFFHEPDCTTNPDCMRSNGRRDVAASTWSGEDQLPLVGAYDSRDPEVLRYHLDLAAAAGLDHFVYDYLGHALAVQSLTAGSEALNEECWEALVETAEAPGTDLKLAVMYEPKVHFLNWVAGQPTKADKVAGITADLVHHARFLEGKRCALRRDGRLVVFVFRSGICDPSGSQCLEDSDWSAIHGAVLQATGEDLLLVADSQPGPGSVLQGFTRWQLAQRDTLTFRTFADARAGTPTLPAPTLWSLESYAAGLTQSVTDWAAGDDTQRLAVQTVWPGFDDSGVGGWGVQNLLGEDGLPLCVRVAEDFDGAFYVATVDAAIESGADWIQVASWNDWNEQTRIEPAWHADYLGPFPIGSGPPAGVHQHVFGRLEETRQWIAVFKGESSGASLFRRIANQYMSRARRLPAVTEYD